MSDLEIRDIRKSYRKNEVLRGAGLSSEAGRIVGIVGRNGCGKSTLLQILAGIVRPEGGSMVYGGVKGFGGARVGYVPQGEPFFEELSARDNLLIFYDKKQMERSLEEGMLKKLGVGDFLDKRVSKLSGGMKKRLSIGCAVASEPSLLLLDEPSSALDLPGKLDLYDFFGSCRESGGIILLVTHDLREAALCDDLYLLKDGLVSRLEDRDDARIAEAIR